MAHTPGPWHTEEGMDDDWWTDIKAGAETVAMCRGLDARKRNDNARLIASAPELLEALKVCAQFIVDCDGLASDEYQQASAAIAKATGAP